MAINSVSSPVTAAPSSESKAPKRKAPELPPSDTLANAPSKPQPTTNGLGQPIGQTLSAKA